ncbi:MAG: LpqB family beta-propeller domain-containing protein [Pseudolysinimonas sp.]
MTRRAALSAVVALAVAVVLAGCANIPFSGDVSKLTVPQGGAGAEPITLPDHPVKGASQQDILEGFIKAGRGPQLNYSVAREFLTDGFRNKWNPNAGALISSSPILPATVGDNELQIAVSVSAEVDATGQYTTYVDAPSKPLQFHFQKDSKGEWRISSAPDGTVLTPNRFASFFHSYDLYFFDPTFQYLVPDRRWFADGTQRPSRIVKGLLAGPPDWLKGVVFSAFPSGTELTGAPQIESSRATVDLTSDVSSESAAGRRRMTQQLTQSLLPVAPASASITVGGFPLTVSDGPEPEHLETVLPDPIGFQKGQFGTLVGSSVRPLPGIGPAIDKLALVGAAVGHDRDQVAALTSGGVSIVRGTSASVLLDNRKGLAVPSLDPEGFVWSVPVDKPGAIIAYDVGSKPHPVAFSFDGQVISMAVSRDGTRLLMAARTSSGPKLFVAGIIRDKDLVPTSLGPPNYLAIGGNPILGASWASSGSVVALTKESDGTVVDTYDLGGQKQRLGSLNAGVAVVGGNGPFGIRVLDSSGSVFSLSGSLGWQDTGLNASFLASQQ